MIPELEQPFFAIVSRDPHAQPRRVSVSYFRDERCMSTAIDIRLPNGRGGRVRVPDRDAVNGYRNRVNAAILDMLADEARELAAYERMQEAEL